MNAAVIGTGIAGLVVARQLAINRHKVDLLEGGSHVGFDAGTLKTPEFARGFDVPLRLFNDRQWPILSSLYSRLGICFVEVDPSQSFSDPNRNCFLRISQPDIFGVGLTHLLNREARRILSEVIRFRDEGLRALATSMANTMSFGDYLRQGKYAAEFVNRYLFPILSSTVCTCSYQALERFPAGLILEALAKIVTRSDSGGSYVNRVSGGAQAVANAILTRLPDVLVSHRVNAIELQPGRRIAINCDALGADFARTYERVVLAVQANQAADICGEPWRSVLSQFEYEDVEVCVHRDQRFLPAHKKDWATFNFMVDEDRACCSISMQKFYGDPKIDDDLFQTINPIFEPESVIAKKTLQRPVVNEKSFELWRKIAELNSRPDNRIFVVGSYASPGIPLLESGVASSLAVANLLSGDPASEIA